MQNRKAFKPVSILIAFVILNLIAGLFIANDYGRSTDERPEEWRSTLALEVYLNTVEGDPAARYEDLSHISHYGTASTTWIRAVETLIFPNHNHSTKVIAHYLKFAYFQLAAVLIFFISRHFMDEWTSLAVALLFGTQPLFFGHAFVNSKDVPLMTTFMLTITLGMAWYDREKKTPSSGPVDPTRTKKYNKTKLVFTILLILLFAILWSRVALTGAATAFVEFSYTSEENSLAGKFFDLMTTGGSLEGYRILTRQAVGRVYRIFVFIVPLILAALFTYFKKSRVAGTENSLMLLAAAAAWGFAISTRVLAIAAGGLIGILFLWKLKQKAIFPLFIYSLTALIVSYITWPFLWFRGIQGYLDALLTFSDSPRGDTVMLNGSIYFQGEIPPSFLPHLMSIQFSEIVPILALIGFFLGVWALLKKKGEPAKYALLILWFFIPLIYVIAASPTIYHNFRHFFFITPPLFIFAGLTLDQLFKRISSPIWYTAITLIILIPNLVAIIRLHPYQYIYYNEFVGGTRSVEGRYALDYWGLAYREAVDYLNENAAPGSRILLWKTDDRGEFYATQDFFFAGHTGVSLSNYATFDYAVMVSTEYRELEVLNNVPVIYTVNVDGANLLSILKIKGH